MYFVKQIIQNVEYCVLVVVLDVLLLLLLLLLVFPLILKEVLAVCWTVQHYVYCILALSTYSCHNQIFVCIMPEASNKFTQSFA